MTREAYIVPRTEQRIRGPGGVASRPQDRARVDAMVDRATREATVRVAARRRQVEQLALPWDGRWPVDGPVQLTLAL